MQYREQLEKMLVPTPPTFTMYGLLPVNTYEKQSPLGGVIKGFVFTNKSSGVNLSVSVSDTGSVTTFLSKDEMSYDLHEYLKFKKRENEYISDFFSVRLDKYIENLCALIKSELGDIITGKRWEDVPRDWMGYK